MCEYKTPFFSLNAARMSTRSIYWVGSVFGGITLATVSASVMWFAEGKVPNGKTVGRDVVLGIVLFFILYQLLPESTTMLITALLSYISVSKISLEDIPIPIADDMEVRVGIPKF